MPKLTLRSSLALWLGLAAVLAFTLLGAGLVLARRTSLRASADSALVAEGERAIARLVQGDPARLAEERLRSWLETGGEPGFAALRAEHGEVLASWNLRDPRLLPDVPSAVPQPVFASLSAAAAEPLAGEARALRVVTLPFRAGEHAYWLQLARAERSGSLGTVLGAFALGALLLALLSRAAARLIVGRVLAPLRALTEAARELSPANLRERFRAPAADLEFRGLEQELNAAVQRLEEGYRAQAHFASNVAHELKTPLAALVADLQVSRRGARDPAAFLAFLGRAEEELKRLSELVESFLVLARVEDGTNRDDLVYVDDVIRRVARECGPAAEMRRVPLVLALAPSTEECSAFVRGDAQLLQAMLANLVRNAIRHSRAGGEVVLETSFDAECVRVCVRDRGPGIPEDLRHAVFRRGVRAPGAERDSNGSGLGLAIVDSVAQLHGGSVSVGQNEGGGSAFVVTLPAAPCVAGSGA